ncbi:MAG: hypothetical protein J1G07_04940 [Clostridiales bacterium]|nr:hypothetical protein [Clostridiales bacterium]
MITSIIICAVTVVLMILSILFSPKLRIKKLNISPYWVIALLGAIVLLIVKSEHLSAVGQAMVANTAINPLKILVLFISMTVLSIFLDELGLFRYLASQILKRAKSGQIKLFIYLYITVSVLTMFTSNDIIILSFTPFICYFAKNAKINPIPFLAAEFVAANTWSMALIIGNPTNIYLATASGIDFLGYIKVSILPTLTAGVVAFLMLFLLFRKKLRDPISGEPDEIVIEDKLLLWVGIAHLGVCTILLAIGSYIGLEMWLVSACAVGSLIIFNAVIAIVRKRKPVELLGCIKRIPYELVPFLLSMFTMIVILSEEGVTAQIANLLGSDLSILKYGATSFLTANIINNIPMSVLFSSIIGSSSSGVGAIYATVIGSNISAFFTPIGALAGIMWSSILSEHGYKFSYLSFLKMGLCIAVPTLLAALGVLCLVV